MAKKYNNESRYYKDWTTSYLKLEAEILDGLINGEVACWSAKDVMRLDSILAELGNRGIESFNKLKFIKLRYFLYLKIK